MADRTPTVTWLVNGANIGEGRTRKAESETDGRDGPSPNSTLKQYSILDDERRVFIAWKEATSTDQNQHVK